MIPRDIEARAMAAKNASRRVLCVGKRIISALFYDFLLISAWLITPKARHEPTVSSCGRGELRRIIPEHRRRAASRQRHFIFFRFRCIQLCADAQKLTPSRG